MFYIRENIAVPGGHFHVSSGERMGWKRGRLSARHCQILELVAPDAEWDRIAGIVHEIDAWKRPVLTNRRFTRKWAEKVLKEATQPGASRAFSF